MKKILVSLLLFVPFLIFGQSTSNDILIINANNSAFSASSMARTHGYLQKLLNATPEYNNSKVVVYGNEYTQDYRVVGPGGGDIFHSLLDGYYNAEHKSGLRAEIDKGYKYVFIACDEVFARYSTELFFEEIYQISSDVLDAGSIPVIFMHTSPTTANNLLEKVYRVANGTGIEVLPIGSLFSPLQPFLLPNLEGQNNAVYAYGSAAMAFSHITNSSANTAAFTPTYTLDEDTYNPIDSNTVIELTAAADIADVSMQALADISALTHYSGSYANQGAMRYRTIDVSAAPFDGTVPFLWRGTSTETGLASRLKTIITQSLSANPISKEVTHINRFKKGWDPQVNVSNVARNAFNAYPDRYPFMYVRAGLVHVQEVFDIHRQTNLLPLVIERPDYSYGANRTGSAQVVLNNCFKTYNYGLYSFNSYDKLSGGNGWNIIPFCPAMARLVEIYPDLASTNDRVHTTDQLYYMQAAMILTSAFGQDIPVPAAIASKSGHVDAFNIGKEFTKQLAFLSETGEAIEQSDLSIRTNQIPDMIVDRAFSVQLEAIGGDGNFVWELISTEALPIGVSFSQDGVLSGVAASIFEDATLAVKVTDGTGAFRKAGFRFNSKELPECASLSNLALGKTATQSSTLRHRNNFHPSNAVDGNRDGHHKRNSITHTRNRLNSWWEVDLGEVYNLDFVKIWNRTNCCAERLTDFHVLVSDTAFESKVLFNTINQEGVSDFHFPDRPGRETDIVLNRTGRYLRIQLSGTNALQLAEVEVMGCELPEGLVIESTANSTDVNAHEERALEARSLALGSEGFNYEPISIAPNPSSTYVTMDLASYMDKPLKYQLYNISGKLIQSVSLDMKHAEIETIDLSSFNNGTYFIRIQSEGNHMATQKIVVVK